MGLYKLRMKILHVRYGRSQLQSRHRRASKVGSGRYLPLDLNKIIVSSAPMAARFGMYLLQCLN